MIGKTRSIQDLIPKGNRKEKWDPLGPSYFANTNSPYITQLNRRDLFYKPENYGDNTVHVPDEFSKPMLADVNNDTMMSHQSQNRNLENFEFYFNLNYSGLEQQYMNLTESFLSTLAFSSRGNKTKIKAKIFSLKNRLLPGKNLSVSQRNLTQF